MFQDSLDEIKNRKEEYEGSLLPPATLDQIKSLLSKAKELFGVDLPPDYTTLLTITNGLCHNGLQIYGTNAEPDFGVSSFIEANLIDRSPPGMSRYLFFGNNPPDIYVWNLESGRFEASWRFSDNVIQTFDKCVDLLEYALRRCIQR